MNHFPALERARRAAHLWLWAGLLTGGLAACAVSAPPREAAPPAPASYRQAMQELVQRLSTYARSARPGFIVVPQNGLGLLTRDGTPHGEPAASYLEAIDGVGQEELFFGYPRYGEPTPPESTRYLLDFLRLARRNGKTVLVIDYCRRREAVEDAERRSAAEGFLSFQAPRRELDVIPQHTPQGGEAVESLDQARTFLYLINPGRFAAASSFLRALGAASHDVLVVDGFVPNGRGGSRWLTSAEVEALQRKPSGERRLVLAYLSVGEAESYRYYWQEAWDRLGDGVPDRSAPSWLEGANPRWPGNYKVRYWDRQWQAILFGDADAYLDGILARGFDGAYLDLVDAYLYFEERPEAAP